MKVVNKELERLFSENFGIVVSLSNKISPTSSEVEDFISEGKIALLKAISSFDEKKGVKMSTYCYTCVRNKLLTYKKSRRSKMSYYSLSEGINISDKDISLAKQKFLEHFQILTSNEKKAILRKSFDNKTLLGLKSAKKKIKLINGFS